MTEREPILYIVVPCYNEAAVLDATARRLSEVRNAMVADGLIAPASRIVFVDDGSKDGTWEKIGHLCEASEEGAGFCSASEEGLGFCSASEEGLGFCSASEEGIGFCETSEEGPGFCEAFREGSGLFEATEAVSESCKTRATCFSGISLGRNVGHQNALYAGLMAVREQCDVTISLDADLQDDPELMPEMIRAYRNGHDIVYTVRTDRACDSAMKRTAASGFYRLMNGLGVEMIPHSADFRLLSRLALDRLSEYREQRIFLRGLVPLLGLPSTSVTFVRRARQGGESKYSVGRMLRLAMDGIVSLSLKPLDLIPAVGLLCLIPSLLWLLGHMGKEPGVSTIIASIWAVGGLLLLAIGILGQYIGRILQESCRRPRYQVRETRNLE